MILKNNCKIKIYNKLLREAAKKSRGGGERAWAIK